MNCPSAVRLTFFLTYGSVYAMFEQRGENKMNKAYKFRIYPNEEQRILIAKTFGCVRFIYNKMLGDKIEYYHQTQKK